MLPMGNTRMRLWCRLRLVSPRSKWVVTEAALTDSPGTPGNLTQNMSRSRQQVIELAQRYTRLAQERQARCYNRGRQQVQFKVGDLVYVDSRGLSSKLDQSDYDPARESLASNYCPSGTTHFRSSNASVKMRIVSNCRTTIWPVDVTPR
ncbi:hypothetical protein PF005_g20218 [Phytophthora fragariae]|uniref:Uncharacterized protein n=2 Tax=Phytophthora fragariae TaxID=53985 RepID=A0A6A3ZAL4_9STRA|nr:hypothetical protein PF009_g12601 [Phytophthora fragariae]KAE8989101.1 hypothetical protein PF011_g18910 [Phytophthora fragariae]KAE9111234.1 hypothetical protein PF007_g11554 [Phytophthora fragariae]KAE9144520.1 hypothetical protein PF006_g10552 [Phytophthora fragariae]KAE9188035.1 hypothetical protein PF005_g20218 [Phytophthora fragariae]